MNEINVFFDKQPADGRRGRYYGPIRPLELSDDEETIYDIHRLITHLENHEFRWEFRNIENANLNDYTLRELRIKYLMGEIDDNGWKRSLQQIEKKTAKVRDIYHILRMFSVTSSDLLRQLVVKNIKIDMCINEVSALRSYVNAQLNLINSRYNCRVNIIRDSWSYHYRT